MNKKRTFCRVEVELLANGSFRYFGYYEDGSRVVLRQKATRLYPYAFEHDKAVGVGKGLAAMFTYGKTNRFPDRLVHQYPIIARAVNR